MNNFGGSKRFSMVGALFCVMPILIVLQVVRIQVDPKHRQDFLDEVRSYEVVYRTLTPARGQLYDRRGNLLAGNTKVFEVGVELQNVKDPQFIAHTVSMIIKDIPYQKAFDAASRQLFEGAVYQVIARNVRQEDVEKLQALKKQLDEEYEGDSKSPSLDGLVFTPQLARIYPEKTLGSNILGFINGDDLGYFGVEERFNDLLAGNKETVVQPLTPVRAEEIAQTPPGASLVLTIDREIQRAMEGLIDQAVAENGAASGTLVVIQPQTGEILAMATTPRMDLNEISLYDEVFPDETPFNRVVGQAYEPGSVFKVLTMAAALDAGAVTPETVFVDTGQIEVGGALIFNWNMGAWGPQNMTGCLQHSLNVCLAWVATQLGPNRLYSYLQAFGIGHLTGVALAGETPGRLKSPGDTDWYAADLGTNSFGQGVSATPLQMATAVSALANNGVMMAPQIVRSVASEGYQHDIEHQVLGQPIKPETARTITDMLAHSLEKESSDALIEGYRVAGKTGTAEIPTPLGYTSNQTNASFVGWGPVDDPQFLVYVWLEKPSTSPWGSVVAAPVFRQAVEQLVVLLNLPPDDVRRQIAKNEIPAP